MFDCGSFISAIKTFFQSFDASLVEKRLSELDPKIDGGPEADFRLLLEMIDLKITTCRQTVQLKVQDLRILC